MNQEIIFGGRDVAVTTTTGGAETVKVRTLKIGELPRYFDLIEDDEQLAAFLTEKGANFIATLTPTSVLDIVEAGHDLNFQTAQRWAARRARNIEALGPIVKQAAAIPSPSSARTAG